MTFRNLMVIGILAVGLGAPFVTVSAQDTKSESTKKSHGKKVSHSKKGGELPTKKGGSGGPGR